MTHRYRMAIDLNVLEHLGINLYSNIAAALTEVVANAWDADAETVAITIDPKGQWLRVKDDGIGMSIEDVNTKYLRVGYQRRQANHTHGQRTAAGRPVMGRKGLGQLSLFSIAEVIEVHSVQENKGHGLCMTVAGIRESVRKNEPYYSPAPIPDVAVSIKRGTCILLKDLKRQWLDQDTSALRKRLARRFSVIGATHEFTVTINDEAITMADRGDLAAVQFLWTIGECTPEGTSTPEKMEQESLPHRLESWDENRCVHGWIGTARYPKQLDDPDAGNLNGIVVFARGRLIHENILEAINDGKLYTKYLTGRIEADFLDSDKPDEPDIATSDRQRIQEDDPRYKELVSFLRSSLDRVQSRWDEWRQKHEVKAAVQTSPALTEWLNTLPAGFQAHAKKLIAKLSALPIDKEEDKKDLYRHGILAFERLRLHGSVEDPVDRLDKIDKLLELLGDRDDLEAALYRDIITSRLEVIRHFQSIEDEDAKEKVLQEFWFDHLWLLDPAWERTAGSELMERRLIEADVLTDDMTEKEKLSRVAITYRTYAGKHIIVELKRRNRKMKLIDLQAQGQTYVDKLEKILRQQNEEEPNIEVIFVLGQPILEEKDNPDRLKHSMAAVSPGSRIVYYDALIQGALKAYEEYLTQSAGLDRLEKILSQI